MRLRAKNIAYASSSVPLIVHTLYRKMNRCFGVFYWSRDSEPKRQLVIYTQVTVEQDV